MNIELFMKEMQSSHADTVLEKHITRKYVPFEEKVTQANNIVEASCYKEVDGKKIFWLNTPLRMYLQIMAMVRMYTDICDENEDNLLNIYNTLSESGVIDKIFDKISEDEQDDFNAIVSMTVEDVYENETNFTNVLNRKIISVDKYIHTLLSNENFLNILQGGVLNEQKAKDHSE